MTLWFLLLGVVCLLLFLGLRAWKARLLCALAVSAAARGHKEIVCKLFERVLALPTPGGARLKRGARYQLSWLRMERGEYEAAAELLRVNLQARLSPEEEVNTRQRLAEALEGAARTEEAEAERRQANALVGQAEKGAGLLLAQAGMLNREQRFAEAYAAYREALDQLPPTNRPARLTTLLPLALTAFHTGLPEETITWGETALPLATMPPMQMQAHSVLGLGYATLGRLEEAETHRLKALELAVQLKNRDQVARYMAQLAEVQARRGHLVEAMQRCEQAKALSVTERRLIYSVEIECLKAWGRFEEALVVLEQAQQARGFPTPSAEQRMRAAFSSECAVLKAELGDPEVSLIENRKALDGLQADAKLTAQYRANQVWFLALLGRREEVVAEAEEVEALLADFAGARGTQLSGYGALGRAFFVLADYSRSAVYWQRYLDLKPDPVSLPKALYFLGEGLRLAERHGKRSPIFARPSRRGWTRSIRAWRSAVWRKLKTVNPMFPRKERTSRFSLPFARGGLGRGVLIEYLTKANLRQPPH